MRKLNPTGLITHEEFKKEFSKRQGFKKIHAENELEFKILEALIVARIEKKITQKNLAKRIGVAQSALARFESGRVNPTLSFLQKVTRGLGLKLVIK